MSKKKEDKPRVSLQLEKHELELLKKRAKQQKKTLSAVIRESLFGPPEKKRADDSAGKEALDAAFSVLDGKTPTPKAVEEEPPKSKKDSDSHHPCMFLRRQYLGGYRPGECEGACDAPRQKNKVCFWTSMVAQNCPTFLPKKK